MKKIVVILLLFFTSGLIGCRPSTQGIQDIPDKTVVLTLDDSVRNHLTFVAPLLKKYGFRATFFVTHKWMDDKTNFLNWQEIKRLQDMGFEVGNHSWTHANFTTPKESAHLESELALVDYELEKVGVTKPVSFAWPGNRFSPEGRDALRKHGIKFARRGMQPEYNFKELGLGPMYDPKLHDPLLIPCAGDAYPNWTIDHFAEVVGRARGGKIAVVQFHGIPDPIHPWVDTNPDNFRDFMAYLHEEGFNVIALGDLEKYVDPSPKDQDSMTKARYPDNKGAAMELSQETEATRDDFKYWTENMYRWHELSFEEIGRVVGWTPSEVHLTMSRKNLLPVKDTLKKEGQILTLPYPGGRHPRIGLQEDAVAPMRGTKVSLFPPWEKGGYVVVDLPGAIFTDLGLTFLAHTDMPTVMDKKNEWIENIDWTRNDDGSLEYKRPLSINVSFGAKVIPDATGANLDFWLFNGTQKPLKQVKVQVSGFLRGATGFNEQTDSNKLFDPPVAAVHTADKKRWILMAFERCGRAWGSPPCPAMNSDPHFPTCPAGETVRAKGRVWFYEGSNVTGEIQNAKKKFGKSSYAPI